MKLEKISVGTQIAVVAAFVALVIAFLMAYTGWRTVEATVAQDALVVQRFADTFTQDLAARVDQVDRTLTYFATSPEVQDFVLASSDAARFDASIRVADALGRMKALVPNLLDIILFSSDTPEIAYHRPVDPGDLGALGAFLREPREGRSGASFSPIVGWRGPLGFVDAAASHPVVLAGLPVFSVRPGAFSTEPRGQLVFLLDPKGFTRRSGTPAGGLVWVLSDGRGTVFDQAGTLPPGKPFPVRRTIEGLGARFAAALDLSDLESRLVGNLFASLVWFLSAFVAMVLLFLRIARAVTRNNRILRDFSRGLDHRNLVDAPRRLVLGGYSEAVVLADTVNGMLDTIRTLMADLLEARGRLHDTEIARRQAEIEMLTSQINPHFFYNTMEVMNGIAASRGVDEIQDIVEALVRMFRYSLKADEMVPLDREIEVVRGYLDIQGHRFGPGIRSGFEVGEGTGAVLVPKMIVQPLVENAVIHGLEPLGEPGELRVRTFLQENLLVVEVSDTGAGVPAEVAHPLAQDLAAIREGRFGGSRRHIGLRNVQRRLTLHYGCAGTLEFLAPRGRGTLVRLTIPAFPGESN